MSSREEVTKKDLDKKRKRKTQGKAKQEGRGEITTDGTNKSLTTKAAAAAVAARRPFGRCVHVSDRYEKVGGRVGEGTYGVVYKARDLQNPKNKFVALKRCIPHHESSDGFPVTALREIQSLRIAASHPHIVALQTVAVSNSSVFLVFEYCEHDLANLIDRHYQKHYKSPFRQGAVKTLLQHLLSALEFLHDHCSIIHRDVKLSNLLYTNSTGMLKLADFGLSRLYSSCATCTLTPHVASLWYRAPELLFGGSSSGSSSDDGATTTTSTTHNTIHYTQAIDMWAAGCVFAELLQGRPILNGSNELDQMHKIIECIGAPPPGLIVSKTLLVTLSTTATSHSSSPPRRRRTLLDTFSYLSVDGLRLLTSLLQYNYDANNNNNNQRWTAAQALQSNYFVQEPWPTPVSKMPRFPCAIQS